MKTIKIIKMDNTVLDQLSYGIGAISRETDLRAKELVDLGLAMYVPKSEYKKLTRKDN